MTDELRFGKAAEHVLLLTLNRPAQRNAIDPALCRALSDALSRFRDEDRWHVAVITGASPAFCAGLDLKHYSAPDAPRHHVTEMIRSIADLEKPIIAAVNGAAFTGGLEIALSCDFIIAAEGARFADTHAKIGALSGSGMGSRLPRAVGARFARQMMFAGEPIDAVTALRVGLINELVAPQALLPRAIGVAELIAGVDPSILRIAKSVVDRGTEKTLGEAIEIERAALAKRKAETDMAWNT